MAEIRINATGGVKLYDADDSHYAQIVAGTITSNVDAITLGHDTVTIADNLSLGSDSAVLKFGADGDTTLTHTDGTGLTLNSTNKLCFNDASQYIQGASNAILDIAATDEIELNATLVDINANVEISGTATTTGVHTFSATPVFPDGSLALADLDIDGGTDIGAAIVDADLFIVDDGAGGTNRKTAASRIKTYVGGFDVTSITGATALAAQPAATDEIVLSDAGTLKRLDIKHISNTPAFMATLSGDQALSDATETKLEFATEVLDSDGKYDNSSNYRFTPTVAGRYLVCLTVFLDSNNDGSLVNAGCILFKNGSGIHYAYHSDHDATGRYASPSLQAIVTLDADDYIEAYGYCDVDGSGSAAAEGDSNTMFCAIRLTGLES
jgi:hypothetical protein